MVLALTRGADRGEGSMTKEEGYRLAWLNLIASGRIVPTGEMRPSRDGVLQAVYVTRDHAEAMGLPLPPLRPFHNRH
jgi:hypothetical protein